MTLDTAQPAGGVWWLVSVSTAGAPPSLRVHVWRKLHGLGAVYVQQSVCLLPDVPEVAKQVRRLTDRVHHEGGSARAVRIHLVDDAERDRLIGEFNTARDEEYAEVLQRLPALHAELDAERARGRATYAEVEESEADLHRFRTWLDKITARDYFGAPGGDAARDAVRQAADALADFEQTALNREA